MIIPIFVIQRKLQALNTPLNTTRLCSSKAFGLILMKIPRGAFGGWDIILSSIHVRIYFSPAPTVPPCGIKSFTLLVRVRPDLNKPYVIPMVRSPSWGTRMMMLMGSINWPVYCWWCFFIYISNNNHNALFPGFFLNSPSDMFYH